METQGQNPDYICKIDYVCLNDLHNILLNKESNRSIYQFCEITHQNIKNCCINPYSCPEGYAKNITQDLRNNSLNWVQQTNTDPASCHLGNISKLISALSGTQNEICNVGVQNCRIECKNKLEEFKKFFEKCFSIQYPFRIDYVLEKAKNPVRHQSCYKEIRKVAEKYKRQSRNKQSLFKENLQAKDIVDCNEIKQSASRQNLSNLALNVCQQAQVKRQKQKEDQEKQKRLLDQAKQAKMQNPRQQGGVSGLKNKNQTVPPSTNIPPLKKTGSSPLLGVGAVAGIAVGGQALKSKAGFKENQNTKADKNIKKSNDKALATTPKKSKTVVSKSKKSSSPTNSSAQTAIIDKQKTASVKSTVKKSASKAKESPVLKKKQASKQDPSHANLAGSELKTSSDSQKCTIPMPEITSTVVYQSVEAPQIEPLSVETDPYNDYDLVANKPAVVLISLQPPQNIKDMKQYSITLEHLKRKNDIVVFPKQCSNFFNAIELFPQKYFKSFDKKQFDEEINLKFNESNCKLKRSDFRRNQRDIQSQLNKITTPLKVKKEDIEDNLYIFVKLPTTTMDGDIGFLDIQFISVSIKSDVDKTCSKRNKFFVSLRNTRRLYLDFMTVEYSLKTNKDKKNNLKCKPYEISDLNTLQRFSDSSEVQKYIPMMFPMSERELFSTAIKNIRIKATCYNKFHDTRNTSIGLLLDALTAENWAFFRIPTVPAEEDRPHKTIEGFKLLNRKTVVIVSKDYMKYHKKPDVAGFFLSPSVEGKYLTGSWNVIFVRDDLISTGTIAHELAHALGQGKEYYLLKRKTKQKKKVALPNNQQYWCKKFSEPPILCHTYMVFGGLMASFKRRNTWKFLNNKIPFMNTEGRITDQWMDRETNQRLFRTLSDIWFNPEASRNQKDSPQQIAPIVSISGIYNKEKGSFYRGSSVFYKKGLSTVSNEKGNIEIRLVRRVETNTSIKYKTLSKINFSTDINMKVISKNGEKETIKLNQVPIVANLPIPKEYLKSKNLRKSLRLIVRENFYTISPVKKGNPYIHNISFGGSSQSDSKKRRTVYNAPIDWSAKPEDFIIRR